MSRIWKYIQGEKAPIAPNWMAIFPVEISVVVGHSISSNLDGKTCDVAQTSSIHITE